MHTYQITIIRAERRAWPYDKPNYYSENAQTFTAQGETWTEARQNMEREHDLDHNQYITWTVEEQN
jgi:predicted RNase H-like HicB family nuclease